MKIAFFFAIAILIPARSIMGQGCDIHVVAISNVHSQNYPSAKKVHYKYNCATRSHLINVSGLGETAEHGELTYITQDAVISISDPEMSGKKANLGSFPVIVSGDVADISSENGLPSLADFSSAAVSDNWSGHDFVSHVNTVLGSRFGPLLTVQVGGITRYISSYQPLWNLPHNVVAKLAVSVSYSPSESRFYLESVCVESRIRSDRWVPAANEIVLKAARDYVAQVIQDLKRS
jgi:hypothetical protein